MGQFPEWAFAATRIRKNGAQNDRLTGNFDANFDLPKSDMEAAKVALEKNLGLTLVKAQRSIDRIVLDAPPAPEKTANPSTPTSKPTPATEKPAQTAPAPAREP